MEEKVKDLIIEMARKNTQDLIGWIINEDEKKKDKN